MNSKNLQLYADKGTRCVSCGTCGAYFCLETQFSDWPERHYCLNLYNEQGVIFTKDHIIPKALGGSNCLENLQPMCINCNADKGDNVDNGAFIKGVFKVDSVSSVRTILSGNRYSVCVDRAYAAATGKKYKKGKQIYR